MNALAGAGWFAPNASRPEKVSAALLLLCICACGSEDQARHQTRDPWYRGAESFDPAAPALPASRIHPVRLDAVAETERLLAEVPIVRLSSGEAEDLVGRRIEAPGELWPFLVRGLARGEGAFFVKQSPTALWVGHTGRGEAPLERRPLVVMLDSWSFDVYVTAGSAD